MADLGFIPLIFWHPNKSKSTLYSNENSIESRGMSDGTHSPCELSNAYLLPEVMNSCTHIRGEGKANSKR
jgi:hypothetical protein